MSEEKLIKNLRVNVSQTHYKVLKAYSDDLDIPLSRLVTMAVDSELLRDNPFGYDLSIPEVDWEDYTYADEATKILDYLKVYNAPIELSFLVLLRHDIGIPDLETFMKAFAECLKYEFVLPYMKKPLYGTKERLYYKRMDLIEGKAKSKRFKQYEKLKREFEAIERAKEKMK